jgi:hypothetical protein
MLCVENLPLHDQSPSVGAKCCRWPRRGRRRKRGGSFADYAVVSLHCLRVHLDNPYRDSLDLLNEMPQILAEIGLVETNFLHHFTLLKALTGPK